MKDALAVTGTEPARPRVIPSMSVRRAAYRAALRQNNGDIENLRWGRHQHSRAQLSWRWRPECRYEWRWILTASMPKP